MSCARRNTSTTAPQALLLLNSEFAQCIASKLAAHLQMEHGSDTTALITAASLRCLARTPTAQEIGAGQNYLQKQTALTSAFHEALADYCLALLNSNEFVYVD